MVNYKHQGRTITLENLTLYQAVLLFIFNSKEEVSFRELTHKLVLSKQELICELEPLLQIDHQVLIKHPEVAGIQQSTNFEDSDKLRLNPRAKFSRSFARLNTVVPSQEVVAADQRIESTANEERLLQEKKASIESHIMRHLKEFKKRTFQDLTDHVSQIMRLELQVTRNLSRIATFARC